VTGPRKGLLVSGCGFIRLPKRLRFYCRNIGSKWLGAAIGKRTTVQIECPHIIETISADPTTEDEELGTDHGCGIVTTTARSGTIDHYAGPLSRYWSAKL
jgi:hypothetical protein